jgi:hypothetical protein
MCRITTKTAAPAKRTRMDRDSIHRLLRPVWGAGSSRYHAASRGVTMPRHSISVTDLSSTRLVSDEGGQMRQRWPPRRRRSFPQVQPYRWVP